MAGLGQFLVELRDLPTVPFRRPRGKFGKATFGLFDSKWKGKKNNYSHIASGIPFQSIPVYLWRQLSDFRNLGSEYLNVVFGWKPFVNDLRQMYNLWKTIDNQMAKIIRENGKGIRRKATISDVTSTTQTTTHYTVPYVQCIGNPPITTGSTDYTVTTRTRSKEWFVGKFQYYIPDTSSSLWNARARAALFGALPTPELLWNVLPWTWLIDWFSNVGDCLSNMSVNAVDNLICRYSFVMRHTATETEYATHVVHPASQTSTNIWPKVDHTLTGRVFDESKLRMGGGNPFGLNVQFGDLSAYQLGILGALGLSRGLVK